ncbi:MAG: Uma2 family endonuclease [Fuerstia sp.]|nr:Uma2 family endonuclease [Fuerstiella sp.]
MSFAAIDQAIIQPPPGTRLPARFSVAQFDAMIDAGVFSAETDRQLQLLNGEIVIMTPPNPMHDDVVGLLSAWAFDELHKSRENFEVRVQLSMDLASQNSVVLPDLLFVAPRSYSTRRPTASDTRLLIEVSDTTLVYDLGDKMRMYAAENVVEYWVIDIPHRSLIVHLDSAAGRFRSVQTFAEHELVHSKSLADVSLSVSRLFR